MNKIFSTFLILAILTFVMIGCAFSQQGERKMELTSSVFLHNNVIPTKYTCQGEDINPPLSIADLPQGTKSLALIIDDPDAPSGMWVHWVVFNIAPTSQIAENDIPGKQGINDSGQKDYSGPCPPSGTHRYFHKIYALDATLDLKEGISKKQLENAMKGHILGQAELIGLYKKVF